jgi:hypothetical protein
MPQLDYKAVIRGEVFEEETFIRLILSRPLDKERRWQKITVRPVRVRGERQLQFSCFDGTKDITRNAGGDDASARLDEVLDLPFGQALVQSVAGDLHVLVNRKGNVHIRRLAPSRPEDAPVLAHDRQKDHPLPASGRDPLLKKLRIVNKSGKVRAAMGGKFRQVNEFLRVLDQVLPDENGEPVHILDCGCGSAYLTFAAFHYLNHLRDRPARVLGIDVDEAAIAKCNKLRDSLGWDDLTFRTSRIADFEPDRPPDLVLSLHACDTATDEALARGVAWESRAILAAPC